MASTRLRLAQASRDAGRSGGKDQGPFLAIGHNFHHGGVDTACIQLTPAVQRALPASTLLLNPSPTHDPEPS